MATTSGVYRLSAAQTVYENQFQIDITGGDGKTADNLASIADMDCLSCAQTLFSLDRRQYRGMETV